MSPRLAEIVHEPALVAVLAGGRGERMGGSKGRPVEFAGLPPIEWPLAAIAAAGLEAVVIAKDDAEVPRLAHPFSHRSRS